MARNMAWQVLIEQRILHMPVNMSSLCQSYGSFPITYDRAADILARYNLLSNCKSNDGFALHLKERFFIFYNNHCSFGRVRFTLAHELGHILLGHMDMRRELCTVKNREPSPSDDTYERQANIFASRLLAPACVLDALNLRSPESVMSVCGISRQSAEFRLERMEIIRARKKQLNFKTHFLERQVMRQFRPFIKWARKLEPHQHFAQFQIVRNEHVIGTTVGLSSSLFTDIVALPPNVNLQDGDRLNRIL